MSLTVFNFWKMKKLIPIIIVLLFAGECFSQAPNWAWAKSAGGGGAINGRDVAIDNSGNVIVTGSFWGDSMHFGAITLVNYFYPEDDIVIAKYNGAGTILWAKRIGAGSSDFGKSVITDNSGNIYLTGESDGSFPTFGSVTATGTGDMFIVKYDSLGNEIWAKWYPAVANGIACDLAGNIIVTGYFLNSTTFGSTTLTCAGGADIFVAKFDSSGNVLWAKSAGGNDNDEGTSICTDNSGNIMVTGYFSSPSITFDTTTLINTGISPTSDVFVTKFDSLGNVLWAKSAAGNNSDSGSGIANDNNGNVFITGTFKSPTIDFDSTILTNDSSGYSDIFTVKYDMGGNLMWAKSAGGIQNDGPGSIATDPNGNAIIAGYFISTVLTFPPITITNASFPNGDVFIMKYDSLGNVVWAEDYGEAGDERIYITTDAIGNIAVTGGFSYPSINFGANTLTSSGGTADLFVAKTDITTGIPTFPRSEEKITISPNPFTNSTTITLPTTNNQQLTTITITDVLGKEIKTLHFTGNECVIEKGDMERGIYFVRVNSKQGIVNRKIVIQ